MNAETAERVGMPQLKQFHMAYIKKKFPRGILDQVISRGDSTEAGRRSPGPGLKRQAASAKLQAPSDSNNKPQASSDKQQASSSKPQASSSKI